MTTSPNLNATHLDANTSTPHVVVNASLDLTDEAMNGYIAINFASDADYTLSTATNPQEWQYGYIDITDTGVVLTTTRNIIVPNNKKKGVYKNSTAQSVVIKTSAGTGVTLVSGAVQNLQCDGTNVISADGGGSTELSTDTSPQLGGVLDTDSNQVRESKGSDIASSGTLTIPSDGNFFDVTGTTTITAFSDVAVGTEITLQFDGVLTLTHHATDLILPTSANITTAVGDTAIFRQYAAGDWQCISYQKANGQAIAAAAASVLDMPNQSKTANFTVVVGDQGNLFRVDTSSGAVTASLPSAATAGNGFTIAFSLSDNTNTFTVDPDGVETINGAATYTGLSSNYDAAIFQCDGTSWVALTVPASGTTDSNAIHKTTANEINVITEKTTFDPDDYYLLEDSEASGVKKSQKGSTILGLEENAQTGTTYTLVLDDAFKLLSMTNAASNVVTIPPNSSVPFDIGTQIPITQGGAGQTTIAQGSGVTINKASTLLLRAQHSCVSLIKTATDTWLLVGDTE